MQDRFKKMLIFFLKWIKPAFKVETIADKILHNEYSFSSIPLPPQTKDK